MVSRAGWSAKSRVPEAHYASTYSRGAFSAMLDEHGCVAGLGSEGVRGLLPLGTLSVNSRRMV
jgi:hypothetical protein